MKDAYGVEDMVFGEIKIKHTTLSHWLIGIPNKDKLVKIVYTEGKTTAHGIGILEGERKGELYFLRVGDDSKGTT